MVRFSARYNATVDEKGRVVLPAPFKKAMGEMAEQPLAIEKDVSTGCLNIYPEVYWNEKVQELESQLNQFNEDDIELLEQFYENFTSVNMAPNGRINIPSDFLEFSGIKKEVVLSGMGRNIRLWDAASYEKRKETRKPLRDLIKERLGNNGE